MEYESKKLLAEKFGLNEVHTYLWNDEKTKKDLLLDTTGYVKVLNSTVKDNDEIRAEIVPSLLKVMNDNKKYEKEVGVFEIGRVCTGLDKNNLCVEEKHLGIVLSSAEKTEKDLYFELKSMLESLVDTELKNTLTLKIGDAQTNLVHPKNNASILVGGKEIGYLGLLHPKSLQKIGKGINVAILEINFAKFASLKLEDKKLDVITKYQTNQLDLNFVVDENVLYQNIENVLKSYETDLDYTFKLVDVYKDAVMLPNKKSMTFSFEISSKTHTLVGEELDKFQNDMIALAESHGYKLR